MEEVYLKYMVSIRCRLIVRDELRQLEIPFLKIDSGVVLLRDPISEDQKAELKARLSRFGIEMLNAEEAEVLRNILRSVDEMPDDLALRGADSGFEYLSGMIKSDLNACLQLFAEVKGISLKQYILAQKMERLKVQLLYSDVLIKELSEKFNFLNVSSLRNEFKKFTGISPRFYRMLKSKRADAAKPPKSVKSGSTKRSMH
jgi:hypothetical protein